MLMRILSRLLPSWLRGGASAQSVPKFMLLDAKQSGTKEGYSSEEEKEAERSKRTEKMPHKAHKRRVDSETHYGVGPHHSRHRESRTDRHRWEVASRMTNRRDNDGDDNRVAAAALPHSNTPKPESS
jgi:hypothetical protein